jgi:arylsulfatase A-like enzyme
MNDLQRRGVPKLNAQELQAEMDAYDESVAYVDEQIFRLVKDIEVTSDRPTIVLVTSDHGEFFGEHGLIGHRNALYREGIRVPLIIWSPGIVPEGRRISEPVTNAYVPKTVSSLIGATGPLSFPGLDLSDVWNSRQPIPSVPVLSEIAKQPWDSRLGPPPGDAYREALRSIVDDRWHYIWHESGEEELYDLVADPTETHDLSDTSAEVGTMARLRGWLPAHAQRDPQPKQSSAGRTRP